MLIRTAWHRTIHFMLLLLISLPLFLSGCRQGIKESSCVRCHKGLEHVSKTHGDCVSCHGGNPLEKGKEQAHRDMFGIADPEDIGRWENGCAPCHRYQFERMKSNLMYTAAGMIRNTQLTWEGEDGSSYTTHGEKQYDSAPTAGSTRAPSAAMSARRVPGSMAPVMPQAVPLVIFPGTMKGPTKVGTKP